ncbi:hypothetical protein PybrP1_009330 [[Pythium] brassicae (nom. inval.)]|nr:hypothetical protein PybrP1_009330 [[Pythium] brassicae (nom. inval.)]
MARSRRSSTPAAPARKAPTPAAPAKKPAPAPAQTSAAPAPVQTSASSGGGMMSGLLGTVAEGMAFGTGSAIARHAVNSVVDSFSSDSKDQPAATAAPVAAPVAAAAPMCVADQKAFMECVNTRANDISACQFYLDALNQCKQQSAYQ